MATVRPQPADVATDGPAAPPPSPRRLNRRVLLIGGVLVLILVAAGVGYWLYARNFVSTDDAFVEARIIHISPKVGGQVIKVNVTDNQLVRACSAAAASTRVTMRRRPSRRAPRCGRPRSRQGARRRTRSA